MKWLVEKSLLLDELKLIQGAIEKKSAIPTLSYFLIQVRDDELRLVASDMELSYESRIPAEIKASGAVALPAKTLTDIVRALPDGAIEFSMETPPKVHIHSGKTRYDVLGLVEEDYPIPRIPELEESAFSIPAHTLKRAIDLVSFVIPAHALREAFLGALFRYREGTFTVAAMDVYRLACISETMDLNGSRDFEMIVHRKALNELRNAIQMAPIDTVRFGIAGNVIVFELGSRRISIRMIDDTFPSFEGYIPEKAPYRIKASRLELLDAFRRVILLSKSMREALTPAVLIKPGEDRLELRFHHPALGSASDEVEAHLEGEPFPIYINGEFIIEFLNTLDDEVIELWFASSREPAAARPAEQPEKTGYYYVFMPIEEQEVAAEQESVSGDVD